MKLCAALFLIAAAVHAQEAEKPTPNPDWARSPEPAKDTSDDAVDVVKVSYDASDLAPKPPSPIDPTHVRAEDDKVVIHPDDVNSYNAGGEYVKDEGETCCNICPRNKDCTEHGVEGCYAKCHRICGAACVVPTIDPSSGTTPSSCTIGIDCGFTASSSGITEQDMPADWKDRKAPKSDNTPDKPNKKWARPPLSSVGATGPAPTDIPVMPEEVHGPDEIAATGAVGPLAPAQPYAADADGPSTPTEQQAEAAERMKMFAEAHPELLPEQEAEAEAEATAFLQTAGSRYLRAGI